MVLHRADNAFIADKHHNTAITACYPTPKLESMTYGNKINYQATPLLSGSLLVVFAIVHFIEKYNLTEFVYLLFCIGLILLIVNTWVGFLYYLSVCLLSTDITFNTHSLSGSWASVHTISIFGMALTPLWTLIILSVVIAQFILHKRIPHYSKIDILIFYIGILYVFSSAIGVLNLIHYPRIFISDLSYYINMLTTYLAIRLWVNNRERMDQLFFVVIGCLSIWILLGIYNFILGIGVQIGGTIRPISDSVRSLFAFPILMSLISFFYKYHFSLMYKIKIFTVGLAASFVTFCIASRGNILLLIFSIFFTITILYFPSKSKKKTLGTLIVPVFFSIVFFAISLYIMNHIRPGSLTFMLWKIESLREYDYGQGNQISSTAVRWMEAQNIIYHLWTNGSIIWGEGIGGWFTDVYKPYTHFVVNKSAYSTQWIYNGTIFKPHGTLLVVLLKMGVLGLTLYLALSIKIIRAGIKIFRHTEDFQWKIISLATVSFLPTLFAKNFTSKLQLSLGVFIAILTLIGNTYTHPPIAKPNKRFRVDNNM